MNSTVPWWGSGLFTLGGALVGALATLSLGLLNRRTERRRLARAEKVATYPEFVDVASRLSELPVWPAEGDPGPLCREVEKLATRIAFLGPAHVAATLGPVLDAAHALTDLVTRIRTDSTPGHGNKIDQRLAPLHVEAISRLRQATQAFATAARADLEVSGRYTPITPSATVRDRTDTIGKISREPGAGSREPGAGSREPGAGSREPGAGSREPGAGSREPGAGSRARLGRSPRVCHVG